MNWAGISESVISAVVGALILSIIFWVVSVARLKKKPVEWYTLLEGYTQLDENDYQSSVAYCVFALKNRTGKVVKDVEVLLNGPVSKIKAPRGTKVESLEGQHGSRILIAAIQARAEISVEVNRLGGQFLDVQKVFVGDEDMGQPETIKTVKTDAVVFPAWLVFFVFPILGWFLLNVFVFSKL